ncbi:MAG: 23S rRNA (guanosine(2251)-2'-O)-methyltransferase RlmB [Prevotellaceae bacterium]|jgi:23S rRNA (guanosine2251-2'-O)-methyltransferase|nr:23S rRNA (guanosine(2251)-2'-O)-methyltransferase RlmB [Prevotellaceae bacterium]
MSETNINIVAGLRPVLEAVKAGRAIERVLCRQGLDGELFRELQSLLAEKKIPVQFVPAAKLNSLTSVAHQGVAAYLPLIEYADMESVLSHVLLHDIPPLVLLLDGITDVRNFGGIARSAECAGVQLMIVPSKGAAPINTEAVKTSAGALARIPVCRTSNLREAIYYLKDCGLQVIAATEKATQTLYTADFRRPTAIVVGAEDTGISASVLKLVDATVRIPLQGDIASLNVSAATAIVLFEAVKQRKS